MPYTCMPPYIKVSHKALPYPCKGLPYKGHVLLYTSQCPTFKPPNMSSQSHEKAHLNPT